MKRMENDSKKKVINAVKTRHYDNRATLMDHKKKKCIIIVALGCVL